MAKVPSLVPRAERTQRATASTMPRAPPERAVTCTMPSSAKVKPMMYRWLGSSALFQA